MNKKGIRVGILLILGIILIGIGGKVFMDKRAEQKEQDLLAVEKQSVKVLKNTFADIAEVVIERTGFNTMTGSYRIVVTLKNTTGSTAYFDYGFVKNSNEIDDYGVVDREVQKKGITKNVVRVTFSNGQEEPI
ncbi:hypothetical protein EGX23_04235 [Enterococcus faecalis]|uniref:DUF1310 family protein n=1 Tax=Enterococcus faecalis TaxID=1351 RepID=A0A3N3Z8U4_ENTFL|nr:hypothetical protein EGW70_04240 [Enterococcus faecalis]ROZ39672.1 hypothetical protein EGX23_04235 [Enterococcus faecalis]